MESIKKSLKELREWLLGWIVVRPGYKIGQTVSYETDNGIAKGTIREIWVKIPMLAIDDDENFFYVMENGSEQIGQERIVSLVKNEVR